MKLRITVYRKCWTVIEMDMREYSGSFEEAKREALEKAQTLPDSEFEGNEFEIRHILEI